jgi:hypothetical protein
VDAPGQRWPSPARTSGSTVKPTMKITLKAMSPLATLRLHRRFHRPLQHQQNEIMQAFGA